MLLNSLMLKLVETASAEGSMASEGAAPGVVSVEVPAVVPKSLRSPRPKPTVMKPAQEKDIKDRSMP